MKRPGPMLLLTSVLRGPILAQRADPRLVVSLRVMRVPCLILAAAALCGGPAAAQTPDRTLAALVNQHRRAARQLEYEGKFREAESKLHEALQAARQLGPANPWIAGILDDLGSIYINLRQDLKAEKYYLRALRTWEEMEGGDLEGLVPPLTNLAFLYLIQGRFGNAEPLLLRAIEIRTAHAGPDHPDVGVCLQNLALLRLRQRRFEEARERLRQAGTIYARNPGASSADRAAYLRVLGQLELHLEQPGKAISYFEAAVAALEAQEGPRNHLLIPLLDDIATAHLRRGDAQLAQAPIERALTLAEAALDPEHRMFASLCETKAQFLRQTGRGSEARQMAKRAREIRASHANGDPRRHTVDIDSLRRPRR